MELAVGGRTVFLTTHKTYCEAGELQTLRSVAQYPPLLQYLEGCVNTDAFPNTVVVRQLHRVAHRIASAVVDVVFEDPATHTATARVLRLTVSPPAALLPIVTAEGRRYALLEQRATLSQGLRAVPAAVRGTLSSAGGFAALPSSAAVLHALGISCDAAAPVSSRAYTVGNEGEPALHLFSVLCEWSSEQLKVAEAEPRVVLLPVDEVRRAGDAAAALVAALLPR